MEMATGRNQRDYRVTTTRMNVYDHREALFQIIEKVCMFRVHSESVDPNYRTVVQMEYIYVTTTTSARTFTPYLSVKTSEIRKTELQALFGEQG